MADVTGPEPPIGGEDSRILVEIRTLVVTLDDRGTTKANLSPGWRTVGEVPGLGDVYQFDLEARNWKSNVSVGQPLGWKNGAHSTAFSETITFKYIDQRRIGQVFN